MRQGAVMSVTFERTETVTHHDWEQVEDGQGGERTRLSLRASIGGRLGSAVRGTVDRPSAFHHRLGIEGWELTGPQELPGAWADRARLALAQLRLRVAGEPHAAPDATGSWAVAVRHRLRVTGAGDVPGGLAPHWAFTPTQMFIDASTSGEGLVCLFGDGPVETHSARYGFAVGPGGVVAFDQLDPEAQVPHWAQEPAQEAARMAAELRAAADRQLTDVISTGQGRAHPSRLDGLLP